MDGKKRGEKADGHKPAAKKSWPRQKTEKPGREEKAGGAKKSPAHAQKSLRQTLKENKTAVILATISILLFAAFVAIKVSRSAPAANGIPAGQEKEFYLAFANDSHSRVQGLVQKANQVQLPVSDDKIAQATLTEFQKSMVEDMQWLAEKEQANYGKIVSAKTVPETKSLVEEEAALTITAAYVLELNIVALDGMSVNLSDANAMAATIDGAGLAAETITVTDFAGRELREDAAKNLNVDAEKIRERLDSQMLEFIGLRKQKFRQAATEFEMAVEAQKLVELAFLMTVSEQTVQ
ncbi:MAG: hypothetical protein HY394_01260 [Candidatus Diapherotrites archaeon]|nr:hypothetical protein [Candidatus Diapherotrites archaeon]